MNSISLCFTEFGETDSYFLSTAISPDGSLLAIGDTSGTIKLWNVEKKELFHVIISSECCIQELDFSPDGTMLAYSDDEGVVGLLGLETKKIVLTIQEDHKISSGPKFSPDGTMLAYSTDSNIKIWGMNENKIIHILKERAKIDALSFSPDGTMLAYSDDDGTIVLWDIKTNKAFHQFIGANELIGDFVQKFTSGEHPKSIHDVTKDDFRQFLVAERDVDTPILTENVLAGFEGHGDSIQRILFSPEGNMLVSNSVNSVRLWDLREKNHIFAIRRRFRELLTLAYSPLKALLAAGGSRGRVWLWDLKTKSIFQTFRECVEAIESVAFSPNKPILAVSCEDYVGLWDLEAEDIIDALGPHKEVVIALSFSPEGTTLASGCSDGSIWLWKFDCSEDEPLTVFSHHSDPIFALSFSPDGRILASGHRDGTIQLWDPERGKLSKRLNGRNSSISSIGFSKDGKHLRVKYYDAHEDVVDLKTGEFHKLPNEKRREYGIELTEGTSLDCLSIGIQATSVLDCVMLKINSTFFEEVKPEWGFEDLEWHRISEHWFSSTKALSQEERSKLRSQFEAFSKKKT